MARLGAADRVLLPAGPRHVEVAAEVDGPRARRVTERPALRYESPHNDVLSSRALPSNSVLRGGDSYFVHKAYYFISEGGGVLGSKMVDADHRIVEVNDPRFSDESCNCSTLILR